MQVTVEVIALLLLDANQLLINVRFQLAAI